IIFVLDVTEGITGPDEMVAEMLRKSKKVLKNKKILVVGNKADTHDRAHMSAEFYSLGLGEVYPISAVSGGGTGELLDEIITIFKSEKDEYYPEGLPRIAVVGRPNVGKSSFINALTGEERTIVTDIAGTTRDAIDLRFTKFGYDILLVDTAGLRKKSKEKEDVEFYSVLRSVRAIERADICILILDAEQGFEAQDMSIFSLAVNNHKGVVVVVNKWDLVEKTNQTTGYFTDFIELKLAPFKDVPIVFTSVHEKQRVLKVLETTMQVYKNRSQKIPTSKLNDIMLPIIEQYPPPAIKSRYVKIKYITQLPTPFPAFAIFCSHPQYVQESYKRFIENKLRENFVLTGAPIEIFFRQK
ncbi:MAG TPA: ribosome biogenesis GTPase Der, partial [Bacteroidia bacterium]|nr:ribosome biogenesis GTPase Der [Bacteroidia bacterium]